MGRPSKLNAEVINSIQQWLRMGYFVEDAARMSGVHKTTLYRYLKKVEKKEKLAKSLYMLTFATLWRKLEQKQRVCS